MNKIKSNLDDDSAEKGLIAQCGESFRRFISLDPSSPLAKRHLKSLTIIRAESLRHLRFHRNKIHCFSRFRNFWEILMMITYGMAFILIPYDVAFNYGHRRLLSSAFISSIISFIDIVVNFHSSYHDPATKAIVLEGRKIAARYIRCYFWVDLLSSFPDRMISAWLSDDFRNLIKFDLGQCIDDDSSPASVQCSWDFIVILSLLKFLQLPLFLKYLVNYLKQRNRSSYFIRIVRNSLAVMLCYHFAICLNFLIMRVFGSLSVSKIDATISEASNLEKYIICFFYATYTLTLFATSIEETSQVDMMVSVVFTLIGFVLHIWLVSVAYMYLRTHYGPSVRFQEIRYQMRTYMAFKRLSREIQQRILTFYDFTFHGRFFRKREIDELLECELRNQVTMETRIHHLKANYFFKQLSEAHLSSIGHCMSEVVFLRNDVICRVDAFRAQNIYLIVSGTVAMYSDDGDEFAHLHDGNIFGEAAFLLFDETQPCINYVAAEGCLLLVLNRTDFMKIVAETPEVLSAMKQNLEEGMSMARNISEEELSEKLAERGRLSV